jgi:regulator of PEP synthase PpsR (kinase-PPPase family)
MKTKLTVLLLALSLGACRGEEREYTYITKEETKQIKLMCDSFKLPPIQTTHLSCEGWAHVIINDDRSDEIEQAHFAAGKAVMAQFKNN